MTRPCAQAPRCRMLLNRSLALAALQRFEEALARCRQSLALRPGNARALTIHGDILHALGVWGEGQKRAMTKPSPRDSMASSAQPPHPSVDRTRPLQEALASSDAALASRADDAGVLNQRGMILKELRRFPEALASFAKAQELQPDFGDAHRHELQLHLLVGDLRRAWWKYDEHSEGGCIRVPVEQILETAVGRPGADSRQDDLGSRRRSLWRYDPVLPFPLLARRAARVILEVERPLRELVAGRR